jgi:hypothetical protein
MEEEILRIYVDDEQLRNAMRTLQEYQAALDRVKRAEKDAFGITPKIDPLVISNLEKQVATQTTIINQHKERIRLLTLEKKLMEGIDRTVSPIGPTRAELDNQRGLDAVATRKRAHEQEAELKLGRKINEVTLEGTRHRLGLERTTAEVEKSKIEALTRQITLREKGAKQDQEQVDAINEQVDAFGQLTRKQGQFIESSRVSKEYKGLRADTKEHYTLKHRDYSNEALIRQQRQQKKEITPAIGVLGQWINRNEFEFLDLEGKKLKAINEADKKIAAEAISKTPGYIKTAWAKYAPDALVTKRAELLGRTYADVVTDMNSSLATSLAKFAPRALKAKIGTGGQNLAKFPTNIIMSEKTADWWQNERGGVGADGMVHPLSPEGNVATQVPGGKSEASIAMRTHMMADILQDEFGGEIGSVIRSMMVKYPKKVNTLTGEVTPGIIKTAFQPITDMFFGMKTMDEKETVKAATLFARPSRKDPETGKPWEVGFTGQQQHPIHAVNMFKDLAKDMLPTMVDEFFSSEVEDYLPKANVSQWRRRLTGETARKDKFQNIVKIMSELPEAATKMGQVLKPGERGTVYYKLSEQQQALYDRYKEIQTLLNPEPTTQPSKQKSTVMPEAKRSPWLARMKELKGVEGAPQIDNKVFAGLVAEYDLRQKNAGVWRQLVTELATTQVVAGRTLNKAITGYYEKVKAAPKASAGMIIDKASDRSALQRELRDITESPLWDTMPGKMVSYKKYPKEPIPKYGPHTAMTMRMRKGELIEPVGADTAELSTMTAKKAISGRVPKGVFDYVPGEKDLERQEKEYVEGVITGLRESLGTYFEKATTISSSKRYKWSSGLYDKLNKVVIASGNKMAANALFSLVKFNKEQFGEQTDEEGNVTKYTSPWKESINRFTGIKQRVYPHLGKEDDLTKMVGKTPDELLKLAERQEKMAPRLDEYDVQDVGARLVAKYYEEFRSQGGLQPLRAQIPDEPWYPIERAGEFEVPGGRRPTPEQLVEEGGEWGSQKNQKYAQGSARVASISEIQKMIQSIQRVATELQPSAQRALTKEEMSPGWVDQMYGRPSKSAPEKGSYDWDKTIMNMSNTKLDDAATKAFKLWTDVDPNKYKQVMQHQVDNILAQPLLADILQNKQMVRSARGSMPEESSEKFGLSTTWFQDWLLDQTRSKGVPNEQVQVVPNAAAKAKEILEAGDKFHVDADVKALEKLSTEMDKYNASLVAAGKSALPKPRLLTDTQRATELGVPFKGMKQPLPTYSPMFEEVATKIKEAVIPAVATAEIVKNAIEKITPTVAPRAPEVTPEVPYALPLTVPKVVAPPKRLSIRELIAKEMKQIFTPFGMLAAAGGLVGGTLGPMMGQNPAVTGVIGGTIGAYAAGKIVPKIQMMLADLNKVPNVIAENLESVVTNLEPARKAVKDMSAITSIATADGVRIAIDNASKNVSAFNEGLVHHIEDTGEVIRTTSLPSTMGMQAAVTRLNTGIQTTSALVEEYPGKLLGTLGPHVVKMLNVPMQMMGAETPVARQIDADEEAFLKGGIREVPETGVTPYTTAMVRGRKAKGGGGGKSWWKTPAQMMESSGAWKPEEGESVLEAKLKQLADRLPPSIDMQKFLHTGTSGGFAQRSYDLLLAFADAKLNAFQARTGIGVKPPGPTEVQPIPPEVASQMVGETYKLKLTFAGKEGLKSFEKVSAELAKYPGMIKVARSQLELLGGVGEEVSRSVTLEGKFTKPEDIETVRTGAAELVTRPGSVKDLASLQIEDKRLSLGQRLFAMGQLADKLNWKLVRGQMALLGIAFSMMGAVKMVKSVWETLGQAVAKLEPLFQNVAMSLAFGPKTEKFQGFLRGMLSDSKSIVGAWKTFTGLTATVNTLLAYVAYKIFSDKRIMDSITSLVDKLVTKLSDPAFIERIIKLISSIIDNLPDIIDGVMTVVEWLLQIAATPGMGKVLAWLAAAAVAAQFLMSPLALLGGAMQFLSWILEFLGVVISKGAIIAGLQTIFVALSEFFYGLLPAFMQSALGALAVFFNVSIAGLFAGILGGVALGLVGVWVAIQEKWDLGLVNLGEKVKGAAPWLMNILKTFLWPLGMIGAIAWDLMSGQGDKIAGDIKSIFLQAIVAASEAIESLLRTLPLNIGAGLADAFARSQIVMNAEIASIAAGHSIPRAASGGYVAETGLAIIHKGETITPASDAGPQSVSVTNYNNIIVNNRRDEQYLLDLIGKKSYSGSY